MGSVCRSKDLAAPSSLSSINSITTWQEDEFCFERLCYLLIEINQLPVRQLERLDGLEDGVPVTVVDVRRERILRVHRVQGDRGLLL